MPQAISPFAQSEKPKVCDSEKDGPSLTKAKGFEEATNKWL